MTIFDFQKNIMSSFAAQEMLVMSAKPTAAVAASSAIVMGMHSQMYGLMIGAVTGAMNATTKLAISEFDAPALPKKMPNPFTFEWSIGAMDEPTTTKKSLASPTKKANSGKPSVEKTPAAPVTGALMPEDFVKPKSIAKPAKADDLKLISGVGPKLETVLNGLGIWTFAQIAEWTPAEVAWVDDFLQFKGRIDRDDWIAQASMRAASQ